MKPESVLCLCKPLPWTKLVEGEGGGGPARQLGLSL